MLDILRGLASLAVVLGHYQHFYVIAPGKLAHGFTKSSLPLYSLFWPFYEHAAMAVHMFYVLSGFVFYFIYCDAIRNKKISAYNFAILRFSRPLSSAFYRPYICYDYADCSTVLDGQFFYFSNQ
jgi:peptidoglycan/LPS O-acetylase OafA/YrhL